MQGMNLGIATSVFGGMLASKLREAELTRRRGGATTSILQNSKGKLQRSVYKN